MIEAHPSIQEGSQALEEEGRLLPINIALPLHSGDIKNSWEEDFLEVDNKHIKMCCLL